MDIRKIKKLIALLESSGMNEIEIVEDKESVRIVRYNGAPDTASAAYATPPIAPQVAPKPTAAPVAPVQKGHAITSPMVGTFYASASPDSAPFVAIGQQVNQGDTVCIIEAMKIMNQIEASQSGVVTEVLCSNGDAVEFGQTLIVVQ